MMKNIFLHSSVLLRSRGLFVLSFFLYIAASAQKEIPELWGHRMHDDAHVLSQETIDRLEQQLAQYEDSTSNQIAVLVISSLEGEALEDFSIHVAEKWKLGTKEKDNGVLLLVAVDDHKMRIEVGYGLEGVLTDAMCNRIIRNEIAPNFRRNDYDAGVESGVNAIMRAISGEYTSEDVSEQSNLSLGERLGYGFFIFLVLGMFTAVALFSQGCAAWGLYVFLIPFYALFPWVAIGTSTAIVVFVAYAVGFPIIKILMNRNPKWKTKMMKWQSGTSGSGWSSGGSSSWGGSSSSFSGGGGSFGGGGSSGSW